MLATLLTFIAWNSVVNSDVITIKSGCKLETTEFTQFWQNSEALIPTWDEKSGKFQVRISSGSQFSAKCSESDNFEEDHFQCVLGNVVRTKSGVHGKFDEIFTCKATSSGKAYKEKVFRNGTCYNGYTNIVIDMRTTDHSYVLASICHNEDTSETLFAKSTIRGGDLDESEPINRPSFKEAGFYPDISANECYTKDGQFDTVATLLGSEEQASQFLQPERNLFLSRGHLLPNGDGIEDYEKKATFYYVNVIGQWQTINAGNWHQLEFYSRKIAETRRSNLTIYTGAYGVTSLPDVNNNQVEIWLGRDRGGNPIRKLPVPRLAWKVLHDELRGDGVAVIELNNPWFEPTSDDILCPDVCDQLSWVTWDTSDLRVGYTYCCTVADFYNAVPFAPNLGNLPLLDEAIDNDPRTIYSEYYEE